MAQTQEYKTKNIPPNLIFISSSGMGVILYIFGMSGGKY